MVRLAPASAFRTLGLLILGALLPLALPAQTAQAHGGGTPRLTNQAIGPYRLYAWTEPEPLRVGDAHVTIAVTQPAGADAQPGQIETPVSGASVLVTFTPLDGSGPAIEAPAVTQQALGDVYYETDTVLPSEGDWRISIAVEGPDGGGQGDFAVAVEAARQLNWTLIGIGGILLLGVLGLIAARASKQTPKTTRPRRSQRAARPSQQLSASLESGGGIRWS
ncbi:MAG: hypothetical protein QM346_01340 [Chloroflexota bacterium]|nr:hypothetical protein [Chloroflexota bacterium]